MTSINYSYDFLTLPEVAQINRENEKQGKGKITSQVENLEIDSDALSLIQKFPNIKSLILNMEDDVSGRTIIDSLPTLENLSIYHNIEIEKRGFTFNFTPHIEGVSFLTRREFNVDDNFIYDKDAKEITMYYYPSSNPDMSDDFSLLTSNLELNKKELKNHILHLYTNQVVDLPPIIETIISPLPHSKYGDTLAALFMVQTVAGVKKGKGFTYEPSFEDFSYLLDDSGTTNFKIEDGNKIVPISRRKVKYIEMLEKIAKRSDRDRIIAKYNPMFFSLNNLGNLYTEQDIISFSSIVPITLPIVLSMEGRVIDFVIRNNLVDVEYTSRLFTYYPPSMNLKVNYEFDYTKYPKFKAQVLEYYPELKWM